MKVYGFPILWSGWNGEYREIAENKYRLDPYHLFGLIPIIGATITRESDGCWHFRRDGDSQDLFEPSSYEVIHLDKNGNLHYIFLM
jgi:hypothetical protein